MPTITPEPPGCWEIHAVRSYTLPDTADQQSEALLCLATSAMVIAPAGAAGAAVDEAAAEAAGRRWANAGREVKIWQSEREGADLNDEVTV